MPGLQDPLPGATWGGGQWASKVGPQGALPCGGVADVSLSVLGSRHCPEGGGQQTAAVGGPRALWSLCPLAVARVPQRVHLVDPALPSLVHWFIGPHSIDVMFSPGCHLTSAGGL